MSLTTKGESLIEPLAPYFQKSPVLSDMEIKLQRILSMERVIVVRGDSDDSGEVKMKSARKRRWSFFVSFGTALSLP